MIGVDPLIILIQLANMCKATNVKHHTHVKVTMLCTIGFHIISQIPYLCIMTFILLIKNK